MGSRRPASFRWAAFVRKLESLAEKIRDAGLRGASLRGELDDQIELQAEAKSSLSQADAKFSLLRDDLASSPADSRGVQIKAGRPGAGEGSAAGCHEAGRPGERGAFRRHQRGA